MRLALSNTRAAAGRLLDACWMEAASIRLPSVIFQVDRLMVITMDTLAAQRNIQQHRRQTSSGQDSKLPDYVQTVVVKDSKGMEKILLLPKALDLDRPKRSRTAFAKWQLDALETTFRLNPYLVGEQRTSLARRLALSETQIKVWYQNRRTKQRKEAPPTGSGSPMTSPTATRPIETPVFCTSSNMNFRNFQQQFQFQQHHHNQFLPFPNHDGGCANRSAPTQNAIS